LDSGFSFVLSLFGRLRKNLVFVHLPKTGGTSARVALLKLRRHRQFILDYGSAQKDTSAEFRDILFDPAGLDQLGTRLDRSRGTFVIGHFRGHKYARYFEPSDYATFLRDPYLRLLSEYNHHLTRRRLDTSFAAFLQLAEFRNIMSRGLEGLDIDRFGFVGVTEAFDRDFRRFRQFLGVGGKVERANLGRYTPEVEALRDDADLRETARRLNADDFALYDYVARKLGGEAPAAPAAVSAGRARIWGEALLDEHGNIHGWIGRPSGRPPRRLLVLDGERVVAEAEAGLERLDVRGNLMSDEADCGFLIAGPFLVQAGIAPGARLRVVEAESGIPIPGSPIAMPGGGPEAAGADGAGPQDLG
jgi:hypothetical protein